VAHHLQSAIIIPGFGHHLYPDGDPRAAALLEVLAPPQEILSFINRVVELTGLKPNIDVALATLAAQLALPREASFALFATARSVGLLAHCMEQLQVGKVIRPRGLYTGRPLEDANAVVAAEDTENTLDPVTIEKNRVFKIVER
jgi:citrate synthase